MASKSTSLALGGSITASVMALVGVGSILLGGPSITDRNQASESCSQYGSGAYLCYDDVVLSGTGGKAGYTSGAIQCGTASCSLLGVEIHTEASPAGARIDVGTVSALTSSGQTILDSQVTASGAALYYRTGLLVPNGHYVKAVFTSAPGAVIGQMRIWYSKFYQP